MTASDELKAVAERLADWVEPAPGVTVYLFGSRVRGDHQPNSDVDVRLYPDELTNCEAAMQWWAAQNTSGFAELKARLPGRLELHAGPTDDADRYILAGRMEPVLVVRKVVCVWTPSSRH
jgi:hypothetical protein